MMKSFQAYQRSSFVKRGYSDVLEDEARMRHSSEGRKGKIDWLSSSTRRISPRNKVYL